VADLFGDLAARVKVLAGEWSTVTLIGSLVLYVLGYLALRFHLTALGMATDLSVVDERYLFTGARFLVYLIFAAPLALLEIFIGWLIWRALPQRGRDVLSSVTFGIIFSLLVIQLVMRQCFLISNLLLAPDLSAAPPWLASLLFDDEFMLVYFSALVAATAVPIVILVSLRNRPAPPVRTWLLGFLASVQILLLPINYGVLIVDKTLPRVAALGTTPLADGEDAWLVWEGAEGVTFLVRNQSARRRLLVTMLRPDVKKIEIVGFDHIVPTLFR